MAPTMFLAMCMLWVTSIVPISCQHITCPPGEYGNNCSLTCSQHCQGPVSNSTSLCDSNNGTCHGGCRDGYISPFCDQSCLSGKYGKNCSLECSPHCLPSKICNNVNGYCQGGCADGYAEPLCKDPCRQGKYGKNCGLDCSQHCANHSNNIPICDSVNGSCQGGCVDRYAGPLCNACRQGKYGKDCSLDCSQHCANRSNNIPICDSVNGFCHGGCVDGYIGPLCNVTCPPGTFGNECKSNCSKTCGQHAANDIPLCNHVNGSCDGGCHVGYAPPLCDKSCGYNYYGDGCKSVCSEFCATPDEKTESPCNHATGICQLGCKNGYEGKNCSKACKPGYYGHDCQQTCSMNCVNNTITERSCNHINGTCLHGCLSGFDGPSCSSTCRFGTYGKDCSFTCDQICIPSSSLSESPCDTVSGDCRHGCVSGYSGPICSKESSSLSSPSSLSSVEMGLIIGICLTAGAGVIAALIIIFYYKRKMKTASRERAYDVPDNTSQTVHQYNTPFTSGNENMAPKEAGTIKKNTSHQEKEPQYEGVDGIPDQNIQMRQIHYVDENEIDNETYEEPTASDNNSIQYRDEKGIYANARDYQ